MEVSFSRQSIAVVLTTKNKETKTRQHMYPKHKKTNTTKLAIAKSNIKLQNPGLVSHLLQHLARKWSGAILATLESTRGTYCQVT